MLGPLPVLYRVAVGLAAMLSCIGLGVWLAVATPLPTPTGSGLLIGLPLGVLAATALTHRPHRHPG